MALVGRYGMRGRWAEQGTEHSAVPPVTPGGVIGTTLARLRANIRMCRTSGQYGKIQQSNLLAYDPGRANFFSEQVEGLGMTSEDHVGTLDATPHMVSRA